MTHADSGGLTADRVRGDGTALPCLVMIAQPPRFRTRQAARKGCFAGWHGAWYVRGPTVRPALQVHREAEAEAEAEAVPPLREGPRVGCRSTSGRTWAGWRSEVAWFGGGSVSPCVSVANLFQRAQRPRCLRRADARRRGRRSGAPRGVSSRSAWSSSSERVRSSRASRLASVLDPSASLHLVLCLLRNEVDFGGGFR